MASGGEDTLLMVDPDEGEEKSEAECQKEDIVIWQGNRQDANTLKNIDGGVEKSGENSGNICYGWIDKQNPKEMKANPKHEEVNLLRKCWPSEGCGPLEFEHLYDSENTYLKIECGEESKTSALNVELDRNTDENGVQLKTSVEAGVMQANTFVDMHGLEDDTSVESEAVLLSNSDNDSTMWDMAGSRGRNNTNQNPDQQSEGDESVCGSIQSDNSSSFEETTGTEMSDDAVDVNAVTAQGKGCRFRARGIVRRPSLRTRIWQEIQKEFCVNRFWLNHYECVDFTVFEFGDRRRYLQFRLVYLPVVLLLTGYIFPSLLIYSDGATPYSYIIYMHVWLGLLNIFTCFFEVVVLVWLYWTTPTRVLVLMHNTPWFFKVTWCCFNIIYPNLMSCYFMYLYFLNEMAIRHGYYLFCLAFLTSSVGATACVTAMPSRLAHVVQPLAFNIFHIIFTFIYVHMGGTNPSGEPYVYKAIGGEDCVWTIVTISVWVTYTTVCHLILVLMSWCRRLLYRVWRTETKPVYGFSPEDFRPIRDESIGSYQRHLPSRDEPVGCNEPLKEALVEAPLPKIRSYSPHMTYRLARRAKNGKQTQLELVEFSPPKSSQLPPNRHNTDTHCRRHLNPRSAFTDIHNGSTSKTIGFRIFSFRWSQKRIAYKSTNKSTNKSTSSKVLSQHSNRPGRGRLKKKGQISWRKRPATRESKFCVFASPCRLDNGKLQKKKKSQTDRGRATTKNVAADIYKITTDDHHSVSDNQDYSKHSDSSCYWVNDDSTSSERNTPETS